MNYSLNNLVKYDFRLILSLSSPLLPVHVNDLLSTYQESIIVDREIGMCLS